MKQMRKSDRQKSAEWALEVFDRAPYVTVSMTRPDGTPYGLPLSLVRRDSETFISIAPPMARSLTVWVSIL